MFSIDESNIAFSLVSTIDGTREKAAEAIHEIYFSDETRRNIVIGKLYVSQSMYIFEDTTCANRISLSDRSDNKYYENAWNIFMPFIHTQFRWVQVHGYEFKMDWNANELPNKVKSQVFNYYKMLSNSSNACQEDLNYDPEKHFKFAVMDHIIRAGRGNIIDDIPVKLRMKYNANLNDVHPACSHIDEYGSNDYVEAFNYLIEHKIIKEIDDSLKYQDMKKHKITNVKELAKLPSITPFDYELTSIGLYVEQYGFKEALRFNKLDRREQQETEMQVQTLNASVAGVKVSHWSVWASICGAVIAAAGVIVAIIGILVGIDLHDGSDSNLIETYIDKLKHYLKLHELDILQ